MRKFLYVCLALPTLNLPAQTKKDSVEKPQMGIQLQAASFLDADQPSFEDKTQKGRCYIFDETKNILTLSNVKYKRSSQNDFTVDIKLDSSDQKKLKSLSKQISGKREIVLSVNGNLVSAPLAKEGVEGSSNVSISFKKKLDMENLLQSLG